MTIRVRHPNTPARDIDLGPGRGQRTPTKAMRHEIDEAIAISWVRGHPIGKRPS